MQLKRQGEKGQKRKGKCGPSRCTQDPLWGGEKVQRIYLWVVGNFRREPRDVGRIGGKSEVLTGGEPPGSLFVIAHLQRKRMVNRPSREKKGGETAGVRMGRT